MTDGIRRTKSFLLCFLPAWLQLLGPEYRTKPRQAVLQIREHSAHLTPANRGRWYHDMLAFLDGSASEAGLLGRPVPNEYERCHRHYLIGWKRLGAGDRDAARAAFQEAYEVMQVAASDWVMARAVLIRMKDPDWPQALAKK